MESSVVNQVDNKFSWTIKNFSSLQSKIIYSDPFVIGGCKWFLFAFPKGNNVDCLSLYLAAAKYRSLPCGWRRHAEFSFTVVNQLSEKLSQIEEAQEWFDAKNSAWGLAFLPLTKLHDRDSGFLVNGELKILVQVDVLHVTGTLDESEVGDNDGVLSNELLNKTQQLQENFKVYGFSVLPSLVEFCERIFKTYPDIGDGVLAKSSHHLSITYILVLLGLIETLCQSPEELTDDDLKEASVTVSYLSNVGLRVDWLKKKLIQVLEKKKRIQIGEEELLKLKKKCSDIMALLEKEKAEVAAAKTCLSFDDFLSCP